MKKNKGITLIALIITIIVMLILVGVVVTVVIQSDLLGTAKNAGDEYKAAYEKESSISGVTINGKEYGSIEEYMEEINPTIVEGDIDDWEIYVDSNNTITIRQYLNSDLLVKKVIIPNFINNVPVKKVQNTHSRGRSGPNAIWNNEICDGSFTVGPSVFLSENKTINELVISNGIETIGTYAFAGTTNLSKVSISQGVKEILSCAFMDCKSLTEITVPSSVEIMGESVFSDIPSITIHVPWKEGEKPEGWDDDWNYTSNGCTLTVDYAK